MKVMDEESSMLRMETRRRSIVRSALGTLMRRQVCHPHHARKRRQRGARKTIWEMPVTEIGSVIFAPLRMIPKERDARNAEGGKEEKDLYTLVLRKPQESETRSNLLFLLVRRRHQLQRNHRHHANHQARAKARAKARRETAKQKDLVLYFCAMNPLVAPEGTIFARNIMRIRR